jgi:outer membrane autotransporter protein
VIDLTPGATVTTNTPIRGVDMLNGGTVLLGVTTPITVNSTVSTTGIVGILLNNTRIPGSLGTGIPVGLTTALTSISSSSYGLRAIQNSSITLGLDLTSNFSTGAFGVRADTGSTVTLIDSSRLVLTGPDRAPGGAVLIAVGPGSVIDARSGTSLSNAGHDVVGIYMLNGGLVRVDASTAPLSLTNVGTANSGAAGIVADNTIVPGGTIDGVTLNFTGIAGTGITATQGAQITASGVTVQGAGIGVVADTNSSVNIRDSSMTISDSNGGIVRTFTEAPSYRTTYLRQSAGLLALGGSLTADSVSISVPAHSAYGLDSTYSVYDPATVGTLRFSNGTVTTSGTGSHGAVALGSPFVSGTPTIQLHNATITTTGSNAHGLVASTGGIINATDSTIRTDGPGSNGLFSTTAYANRTQNAVSFSGGRLSSAQSAAIQVTNSQLELSLTDGAQVSSDAGLLINTASTAVAPVLNLTATGHVVLTGDAQANANGTVNMALGDGTTWTGAAHNVGAVSLADSTWNVTANSDVASLSLAPGTVAFAPPAGSTFKTLAVRGDYASSTGMLTVNTQLNAGGPLSNQLTDRLLILGNAEGTTSTAVNNAGGAGAFTSLTGVPDAVDGISLIQVAGTSTLEAFTLPHGYVTGGTPFQYKLNAYGPGSPNGAADPRQSLVGNAGNHWDYRLQNAYVTPQGPVEPETESPSGPVEPEPGPPAEPGQPEPEPPPGAVPQLPPNARPEVAPQVPAYLSTSRALFQTGLVDIDSLHRRLGEIRDDQMTGNAQTVEGFMRTYGGLFNYTTDRSFQSFGYNFNLDYGAVQFGASYKTIDNPDGTLRLGLAGTFGRLWMQPSAVDGASDARFDTQTLAGMATWQDRAGWYIDGIVMGGLFNGRYTTAARGQIASVSGNSVAVSVESGIPFPLPWWDLSIEPQIQLVWQHLSFADRTDGDGIEVSMGSPDQGVARVGFRLIRPFMMADGSRLTPYLKANLLQGIGGSNTVVLSGVSFGTGKAGTALQVGAGITGALTRNLSLYGDVAWQNNVGSGGFRGWVLNGGLRLSFGEPPQPASSSLTAPAPAAAVVSQ